MPFNFNISGIDIEYECIQWIAEKKIPQHFKK